MGWQFTIYAYTYLATAAISAVVTFFCWRRRKIPAGWSLFFLMLSIAEWAGAGALEMAAVGIPAKIFWSQVAYVGTTTSPVLFMILALDYTRQTKWLRPRTLALVMVIPALTILVAATNGWHHLEWTSFTPSPYGDNILIYGHGPWFWVLVANSYVTLTAGMLVFGRAWIRLQGPYRQQVGLILVAFLIPCVWNVIYVFGLSPIPGLDATPIAFSVTGWITALGILRFRLLDLSPVAREALIEHMADGVLVFDGQHRLIDINPAGQTLLRLPQAAIGGRIERLSALIPSDDVIGPAQTEIVWEQGGLLQLDVRVVPLHDHGHRTGCLLVLRDIGKQKRMESALQEMNSNLEASVAERTAALQTTVAVLEGEIADRKRAEERLRQMEEDLAERVATQSRNLSALYELILYAGQSLTVEQIQEQALATIMTVMNSQAGCTHQWDSNSQTLKLLVQKGLTPELERQILTVPVDWILSERITHTVTDLQSNPTVPAAVRLAPFQAYLGVPIYLLGRPIGALSIFWDQARYFSVEDIALFSAMADQLGIVVENARLREQGEAAAAMKERRRLARDLHDSVTQSLHSLVLHAEIASHRLGQGKLDRLGSSLDQLAESARQALKEMRLLLYELRLMPLDQTNIVEALQLRLDAVEKRAGVETRFVTQDLANMPRAWEEELYCIAMEALNNALKYARASRVTIRLSGNGDRAELEVADDGQGINPHSIRPGGMGLQTMKERAERIGGVLAIDSSPGAGTRICVRVPEVK
jgi:signal transduction histidine kinase